MNIPLGYEIKTGRAVSIPVNHTVVLGQTQLSGKTTTLEAMITRSGVRAVGFITKPGEKSFRQQTAIPPFFSESTLTDYWKYVVSIVESLMAVKLGWQERGWIVKLCQDYEDKTKSKAYSWKRPKSLAELLANVKKALPHVRGTAEMVCMQLQEYLQSVVREIGQTEFSSKLELERGINVMDVTELSDGLKALVIRSVIEWVHKHGRKIVVIIPEAWKFIPEGRSTPVKLALEGLIREGAGIGNFVWMDSQDLRGVDKLLLRSVIVWLFGVQRQKNEVASTLASIPDHPKPSATEIMQLGKGEFYVCYGSTLVHTYVQPAGMEDAHAQAIARGEESPDSWRQISKALDEETEGREPPSAEHGALAAEASDSNDLPVPEIEETMPIKMSAPNPTPITERFREYLKLHAVPNDLRDNLVPFLAEFDSLVESHDAMARRIEELSRATSHESPISSHQTSSAGVATPEGRSPARGGNGSREPFTVDGAGRPSSPAPQLDEIYRYIVDRSSKDPVLLDLLVKRPELRVTVERQVVEFKSDTIIGGIAILISNGFFHTAIAPKSVIRELRRRGYGFRDGTIQNRLAELTTLGFLTKEVNGYQEVPGMKVHVIENHSAMPQEKGAAAP